MRKRSSWLNKVLHRMPDKRATSRFGYEIFAPAKSYLLLTVSELVAAWGDTPPRTTPER